MFVRPQMSMIILTPLLVELGPTSKNPNNAKKKNPNNGHSYDDEFYTTLQPINFCLLHSLLVFPLSTCQVRVVSNKSYYWTCQDSNAYPLLNTCSNPILFRIIFTCHKFFVICRPNFALGCYCKQMESTKALWEHGNANTNLRARTPLKVRLPCPNATLMSIKGNEITFG